MSAELSSITAFSALDADDLQLLQEKAERLAVPRGTVLIRQGDAAEALYFVIAGRFTVVLEDRQAVIAEIGPGESIGELAFLSGGARTASVVAARDSQVLMLTRESYSAIVKGAPRILATILAATAGRLAQATATTPALKAKRPRTVALLPIGESHECPRTLIDKLRMAAAGQPIAVVTSAALRAELDGNEPEAIARYLDSLERQNDLVIFVAERLDSTFSRTCLHQADDLVLVAPLDDYGSALPGTVEIRASELFREDHRSLVLWRKSRETPISDTARWLEPRDISLHHHVALDSEADIERWLRFLSGRAVGLVLGGGAALGCAHLGVAKALLEAGIPIDFVGGTSVGAAMAGALAADCSPDEVMDRTEDIFVRHRAMRRFTFPLYSLLDHQRLDRMLMHHYGTRQIEDLPLNFFAVSTNLTTNAPYVHRRGRLWEAIRASSAIPGMLPPFITKSGDVLVDGAVVDRTPVRVMRKMKCGPNVVVSFPRGWDWRVDTSYSDLPGRWGVLRDLALGRRKRRLLGPLTIVSKAAFFSGERTEDHVTPEGDLFLAPTCTRGMGMLDWHKGRAVAAAAQHETATFLAKNPSVQLTLSGGVPAGAEPTRDGLRTAPAPAPRRRARSTLLPAPSVDPAWS